MLQRESISLGNQLIVQSQDGEKWRCDLIRAIHEHQPADRSYMPHFPGNCPRRGGWAEVHEKRIRQKVLHTLGFRNMEDRQRRIAKAYEETFEWVFCDTSSSGKPWSNFRNFLTQSSDRIYWITGKPGAGKSTLMKYIRCHDKTKELLNSWSNHHRITQAAFYFWNSGGRMQMTVEGLLRTLLQECLRQLPSAIPDLLPERWEAACLFDVDDYSWSFEELSDALRRLVTEIYPRRKFFFMIDGLDECSGDHRRLIELISELAESAENLKLCVASRPWTNFEDAFKRQPQLMLQDLTKADIDHYVTSMFNANEGFSELQQREPKYSERLLADISNKAEGVFLWVFLVVQSLLDGLTNGDRVRDLKNRLEKLPRDLGNLFERILHNLDESYLTHASQLFQIVKACDDSPTLLCVALADIGDGSHALNEPVEATTSTKQVIICKSMRRRLISRCRGLLDVSEPSRNFGELSDEPPVHNRMFASNSHPDCYLEVQYLHRSVRDFIEAPRVWKWILSINRETFDPNLRLFKSYLLQLKSLDPESLRGPNFWFIVCACIKYAKRTLDTQGKSEEVIILLEELDRVSTLLTTRSEKTGRTFLGRCGTLDNSHWSAFFITHISQPSFLHLMSICGIHQYLETHIQDSDLASKGPFKDRTPLLIVATLGAKEFLGPHIKAIQVILEKGGDCHEVHRGNSAWKIAQHASGHDAYKRVFSLFMKYGGHSEDSSTQSRPQLNSQNHRLGENQASDGSDVESVTSTEALCGKMEIGDPARAINVNRSSLYQDERRSQTRLRDPSMSSSNSRPSRQINRAPRRQNRSSSRQSFPFHPPIHHMYQSSWGDRHPHHHVYNRDHEANYYTNGSVPWGSGIQYRGSFNPPFSRRYQYNSMVPVYGNFRYHLGLYSSQNETWGGVEPARNWPYC